MPGRDELLLAAMEEGEMEEGKNKELPEAFNLPRDGLTKIYL